MSETEATAAPAGAEAPRLLMSKTKVGLLAFLASEAAFFATLIVAYLRYMGQDIGGPTPSEALHLGIVLVNTAFLLSSSLTVYLAERSLGRERFGRCAALLLVTLALGLLFLAGTAWEWRDLVVNEGLTPWRNLFGSRFFTLIGFHALHVTAGVIALGISAGLVLRRRMRTGDSNGVELVSWYWHFVDVVWVLIFTIVYLIGR